jgi:DNA-3-methyladenine glycosylase I
MPRCPWATTEPNVTYHDKEWGVPVHDDRILFEFLILEGAQTGLSWTTILKKRENYRKKRSTDFTRRRSRATTHAM